MIVSLNPSMVAAIATVLKVITNLKQMFGNVIDVFPYAGFRSIDNTLTFVTSCPCKIDLLLEYITCSHFYI